jgi:iron complex transport system ATP-binding protein
LIVLEARRLTVTYGSRRVVDDVSARFEPGGITAIVGPNGAGKTTFLRALAGFIRPSNGDVLVDGRPILGYPDRERARIVASVPQSSVPPAGVRSFDLVLQGRHPHLGRFSAEGKADREIAERAMLRTGTAELAGQLATTLSGGEWQRLVIARALTQEARIMLLDEPTAHLDIRQQLEIMELLAGLGRSGLTIVIAIHDLQLAARYAGRILVLNHGALAGEGQPIEVLASGVIEEAFGVWTKVLQNPELELPIVVPLAPRTSHPAEV